MRYTLLFADYLAEAGFSIVTIEDEKGRIFTGKSKVAEGEAHPNRYTGCRYAREKAEIKALKAKRKDMKEEYEVLRKYVKALGNYKKFDKNSDTARCVYRQLNRRLKEISRLDEVIRIKTEALYTDFMKQDVVTEFLRRNAE